MKDYPKGYLADKFLGLLRRLAALHIPVHAAHTGYFMVLSAFPALLLVLSALSHTSLAVEDLLGVLEAVLPEALMPGAKRLVRNAWNHTSGLVLGLSAAAALWSASRGIHALLAGLNAVYGAAERRNYFRKRIASVAYTFVFFLMLLLSLVLHVFGRALLAYLDTARHPLLLFLVRMINLRFFLLLALQSLVFALMYTVLPNRRGRFLPSLPGGLAAGLGWLVFSDLFSWYAAHGGRYTAVYGSIYGLALTMVWLYCCLSIFFFGGALNRWLEA